MSGGWYITYVIHSYTWQAVINEPLSEDFRFESCFLPSTLTTVLGLCWTITMPVLFTLNLGCIRFNISHFWPQKIKDDAHSFTTENVNSSQIHMFCTVMKEVFFLIFCQPCLIYCEWVFQIWASRASASCGNTPFLPSPIIKRHFLPLFCSKHTLRESLMGLWKSSVTSENPLLYSVQLQQQTALQLG
jgi:hypothetical protein